MDLSRHLVLYSGGADSTYLLTSNPSAKHLIHYRGLNEHQTRLAVANAFQLDRTIDVVASEMPTNDGETTTFHALLDTAMVLNASIRAVQYGMMGVAIGFNKDDIGFNFEALQTLVRQVDQGFEIATPLIEMSAKDIRSELTKNDDDLQYISCMVDKNCGHCPKCRRGY